MYMYVYRDRQCQPKCVIPVRVECKTDTHMRHVCLTVRVYMCCKECIDASVHVCMCMNEHAPVCMYVLMAGCAAMCDSDSVQNTSHM
jgi:hypothetical protein